MVTHEEEHSGSSDENKESVQDSMEVMDAKSDVKCNMSTSDIQLDGGDVIDLEIGECDDID